MTSDQFFAVCEGNGWSCSLTFDGTTYRARAWDRAGVSAYREAKSMPFAGVLQDMTSFGAQTTGGVAIVAAPPSEPLEGFIARCGMAHWNWSVARTHEYWVSLSERFDVKRPPAFVSRKGTQLEPLLDELFVEMAERCDEFDRAYLA